MKRAVIVAWLISCFAAPMQATPALALSFPAPVQSTATISQPASSFQMAIGPFANGKIPTTLLEGAIDQQAWQLGAPGLSTLQQLQPLRDQIAQAGYRIIFECSTRDCGGFDFRYGIQLLPEPDMHVDLGDFRYLVASRPGPDGPEYVNLVVSKSAQDGFVQITRVGKEAADAPDVNAPDVQSSSAVDLQSALEPADAAVPGDLAKSLESGEAVALEDLVFQSGSSELLDGTYPSLSALAAWLQSNSGQKVTLVGHTDASGSLASNVVLSKQRAESVRMALINEYGIPPNQVMAEGVGYLAPRATNHSDAGMQRNRRVEVLVTSDN